MKHLQKLFGLALLLATASCGIGISKSEKLQLSSPDQNLEIILDKSQKLVSYTAEYKSVFFVEKGTLGIDLQDSSFAAPGEFKLKGPEYKTSPVKMPGGKLVELPYNEYRLSNDGNRQIELRLFNNAFCFRYVGNESKMWKVNRELSNWQLPGQTKTWFFERKNDWKLKSYAGEWISCILNKLDSISPTGPIQGTPLVFDFGSDVYGFVSEVALNNYSGMRLLAEPDNSLTVNFTEKEGFEVKGDLVSPWRVFYIGDGLTNLVNQQITQALSPKPDPAFYSDISYIKPGKSVWRWWSKRIGTSAQEAEICDFAAQLNFEYSLIDEGWEKWENPWVELKKIADHACKVNVKVLVWKHSNELNFPENDYQRMKDWLDKVKASGAVGVKVDFMNGESKSIIDFDVKLLQEAAKRQLVIVFHGCQKPSGENFTFPNELTREGIRGLELNDMKEGPIPAYHNAALPFTRFVVGNGDYTPLGFTKPGNTTWAHQLATLVCFTSYLQVIAEDPEFLLKDKRIQPVLDIIIEIPTVWDETIVLQGSRIGEVAAMARRKGTDWYVGILNTSQKNFKLSFSFLDKKCKYEIKTVQDTNPGAATDTKFELSKAIVDSSTKMNYLIYKNGGLVIYLKKKE